MQLLRQGAGALLLTGLVMSGPAMAHQAGDVIVRFGAAKVAPEASSDPLAPAPLTGGTIDVGDDTQPGLTVTWMASDWLGLELLGALPFQHDLYLEDTALGRVNIGDTRHLPPTVLAQFYLPEMGPVRPYVGAGLNYTFFFDEDIDDGVVSPVLGGADADVKLSDSWGLAWEVGADIALNERWLVNVSAWQIDINTEATLYVNDVRADKVDVEIDPWVYMVGVGYRF
ncbi:MAG: outer membrane beta-barrel protein [Pseudomonadales bacterium]|nr:outer membrane beta-barrel protein [Pseudomonadales bacterium]